MKNIIDQRIQSMQASEKKWDRLPEDEFFDDTAEEDVVVRRPARRRAKRVDLQKETASFAARVKNTLHGFFVVTAVIALAAAVVIWLSDSTAVYTIQLPEVQITSFRAVVSGLILFVILASITNNKNK